MALIDKASLLMVPSTYEAGKLYNVLPSGNRAPDSTDQNSGYDQTRADFDFDRGSNAAATRVNAAGLIEKYRENLLLRSNAFSDSSWNKLSGSSVVSQTATDPFGVANNAWLFNFDGTVNGRIEKQVSVAANGVYNYSVYLRVATGTQVASIGHSGWALTPVTITTQWQRFEGFKVANTNTSYIRVLCDDAAIIEVYGYQLETGLVATDYLNSGATTAKAGVLVDLPRINYDANGNNGALLLEPSATQLIGYSEYFGDSYWTKSGSTVVSGFTSPEGLSNAYKLVEDTGVGTYHQAYASNVLTSVVGEHYSCSFFAKSGERDNINVLLQITNVIEFAFDLDNKTATVVAGTGTAKIEELSNGWFKCSGSGQSTSAGGSYFNMILNNGITKSYTGDGTSGAYIYGANLTQSTFATSYIPNHGTSGGVTRAADSCSVTGASDVIGQTEGTMFAEFKIPEKQTASFFSISNGTYSNRIIFGYTAGVLKYYVNSSTGGFSKSANIDTSPVVGQTYKIAVAYKNNDFKVYKNGINTNTETTFTVPASLTEMDNQGGGVGQYIFADVKQITLFKERLTNAELATLTTL